MITNHQRPGYQLEEDPPVQRQREEEPQAHDGEKTGDGHELEVVVGGRVGVVAVFRTPGGAADEGDQRYNLQKEKKNQS